MHIAEEMIAAVDAAALFAEPADRLGVAVA
jgi:hypothetical protein